MLGEIRDWVEELECRCGVDAWPAPVRRVAVGVALAAVAAVVWRWGFAGAAAEGGGAARAGGDAGVPRAVESSASARPSAPVTVTVHVVGAVRRPGVYRLPGGSRAIDAVTAAGGLLGNADQGSVNLARVVADGEQVAVPVAGAPGGAGSGGGGVPGGPAAKVDINSATAEQLDALPGVGPATAAKIIADRTANGPFRSVEDLLRVPGIGAKKLDALRDLVTAG